MSQKYNGKGDPRCLGDQGLRPAQIVSPEVYKALGKRFRKTRGRMDRVRWKTGAMRVRCYWYQLDQTGGLIPRGYITTSRIVDKVEFVPGRDPELIRGWVIWGGEYVEVRKWMGERYWKLMKLIGDGDKDRSIGRGRVIAWPQEG